MKTKIIAVVIVVLMVVQMGYGQFDLFLIPKAKAILKVVDENGAPLPQVKAVISFIINTWNGGGDHSTVVDKLTNKQGEISGVGRTSGKIGFGAAVEGYYGYGELYVLTQKVKGDRLVGWEPEEVKRTIVLKKKIRPIAMYVKDIISIKMTVSGKPIGYDLMEGDWVAPYGKGKLTDIFFRVDRKFERTVKTSFGDDREYDATFTVSFPNKGDGIQYFWAPSSDGSELRSSQEAPLNWYESKLEKRALRIRATEKEPMKVETGNDDEANYYFRIRTQLDEQGRVVSALYGKVYKDINFWNNGVLRFMYYVNPVPNDRGMEFDPEKNLFKGDDHRYLP